jgi:hypothetical protein
MRGRSNGFTTPRRVDGASRSGSPGLDTPAARRARWVRTLAIAATSSALALGFDPGVGWT